MGVTRGAQKQRGGVGRAARDHHDVRAEDFDSARAVGQESLYGAS